MAENEINELKTKEINGVTLTDLDISKIAMICDYLVLDRFNDISSFVRFEKCFGPLFSKEPYDFLIDAYQEICGPKKKYLTFGRLILAYTRWKSNSSTNENFNKFMDLVFNKMIKTQDEVIGKIVEGGRIFSTRSSRGRKVISKFSVITDESKNNIQGFMLEYDDCFDTNLSTKKAKEEKNVTLEINFPPTSKHILDRDGVSHIAGKYSLTTGVIKFLIFKCRSGKTFYLGDNTENEGEQIDLFILGTSSCQIKSLRIETVKEQLIYLEAKFQASLRVNPKIVTFDKIDEKYIKECIMDAPLIFEESDLKNIPEEKIDKDFILKPAISDDAFIEKGSLDEKICGKDFNEVYKSYFLNEVKEKEEKKTEEPELTEEEKKKIEEEKEEIKKQIYQKTIQRKVLLRISFNKFKKIDKILEKEQQEERINMDKYLVKIKRIRKKIDRKKAEIKEELEKEEKKDEEKIEESEEEEDWPEDKDREKENEDEDEKKGGEEKKELDEINNNKNDNNDNNNEIINDKKVDDNEPEKEEKINKEKENDKDNNKNDEPKVEEEPKKEENGEVKNEEIQNKEENIDIKNDNEPKKEEEKVENNEPKKEEEKVENVEPKKEEEKVENDEPKKEEEKVEIKNEDEPKKEEENVENVEPKKEEEKVEIKNDVEPKKEEEKVEIINNTGPKKEEEKVENIEPKKEEEKVDIKNDEEPKKEEDKTEIKLVDSNIDKKENNEIKIDEANIEVKIEDDKKIIEENPEGKKIRLRGNKPHKLVNKKLNKEKEEIPTLEEDKDEELIKTDEKDKEKNNNNINVEKGKGNDNIISIMKEKDEKIDSYEQNLIKDTKKEDKKEEKKENGRKTGACNNCIII